MNLAQLRERTRELSGIRTVEIATDERVDSMLDEAHRELCGHADWPFLYVDLQVPVTAGVSAVELPVELRRAAAVLLDGRRLRSVTVADLDRLDPFGGQPEAWARLDAERVMLWPTPEAAGSLQVKGYRHPARLSDDADAPAFESEFHMALAYAAASRLLVQEGDESGRAEQYVREMQDAGAAMRVRYLRSEDTASFQRGGRRDGRRRWRL